MTENQDERERLVRQAEELAYSTDWRSAARLMRHLRLRWRQVTAGDEFQNDPMSIRFRLALQAFLDRRAEFFQQGHREKGERLRAQIDEKQQRVGRLRESLQSYRVTLQDFEAKLKNVDQQERGEVIKAFIVDSILAVRGEIERQEGQLQALSEEMARLGALFHGT